ncbi:polysaccharide deacetylase family protein [Actinomadura latina]|uniref:polysaccharide deacetylase family protein n=1 Tax=Actinomadura latina TaxID=163603 RepID=UPI000A737950|nr:polysaccharide deacetylase family protein [Actinomadura latina]
MRIRKIAIIGAGLLLVAGCSHADKRQARTAGEHAALGRGAQAPRSPSPPPPRKIDCDRVKCVALTFDDGPGPYTAGLLDTLRKDGVRATFFMLGENVGGHRDVVRRMALEGHELADHSWSHPELTSLSSAEVRSQIQRTQKVIKEASGGVEPTLMRPPYGATNKRVGHAVGMPLILWSVDTLDWRYHNVARDVRVGTKEAKSGGIILFHDIHKTSVESIPKVVAGLKKRGFTLVTVSELFQGRDLKPGETYTERTVEVTAEPPPYGSPAGPGGGSPAPSSPAPSSPAASSPVPSGTG